MPDPEAHMSDANTLQALLHELRTGQPLVPREGEVHRARMARGPTSLADLQVRFL